MIYKQHKKTASLFSPTQNLIYKTHISLGFIAAILSFSSSVTKPDKASFIRGNNLYSALRKALLWFYLQDKGKWLIHRACSTWIWMAVYQGAGIWKTGALCRAGEMRLPEETWKRRLCSGCSQGAPVPTLLLLLETQQGRVRISLLWIQQAFCHQNTSKFDPSLAHVCSTEGIWEPCALK